MNKKISNLEQIMYARIFKSEDSASFGNRFLDIYNGKFNILISLDKGFDIASLKYKGINISFLSKNGINNTKSSFLTSFEGGFLYTCGFENVGNKDGYEMHGSYHYQKAEIVKKIINDDYIEIEAIIRLTSLFGENVENRRTIRVDANSDYFYITDSISNLSFKDYNFVALYHINFGFPFLGENTKIGINSQTIIPRNNHANANIDRWSLFEEPVDNEDEEVFYHMGNRQSIKITGNCNDIEAIIEYDYNKFPFLVEWKSYASGDYALGIEPSTSMMDNNLKYIKIKPNEKFTHTLKFQFNKV